MLNGIVMPTEDLTHQNLEQLIHRDEQQNFPHQIVFHVYFVLSFRFHFPALLLPGLLSSVWCFMFPTPQHSAGRTISMKLLKIPYVRSCLSC